MRYFNYDGVPAYQDEGLPVRVQASGETRVYDAARWAHNAQEITKGEFDALVAEQAKDAAAPNAAE